MRVALSQEFGRIEEQARLADPVGAEQVMEKLMRQLQRIHTFIESGAFLKALTVAPESEPEAAQDTTVGPLPWKSALVVDDDRVAQKQIRQVLTEAGITEVCLAGSAPDALVMIGNADERFELIVCDLRMPDMDGVEFLRHLHDAGYAGSLLLISAEGKRILKAAEAVASAYSFQTVDSIVKPLTLEQLRKAAEYAEESQRGVPVLLHPDVGRTALLNGIRNREFLPYYQPQVDIRSKRLVGMEMLCRWPQYDHLVEPASFIHAAEYYGLLGMLMEPVTEQAMENMGRWAKGAPGLSLAVNVTVDLLVKADFPERLEMLLDNYGLGWSNLVLEVTESRLVTQEAIPLEVLTRLRLKGAMLSIDDFGTGYSGLLQLGAVPFEEMKLDRKFVQGARRDGTALAILESSVELAKKLDMSIVAEGVESDEDWRLVESLGCDCAQGFYIAKPMPAQDLPDWMEHWNRQHGTPNAR